MEPAFGGYPSRWVLHPWGTNEGGEGSTGLLEPHPVCQNSVSLLAGWLFALLTSGVFVWVDTPPANSPPRACLRHQAPPAASHFSQEKAAPPGPHTTPATALKVGAGRQSQNCLESKQLRTQSGLARRLAATKGHCEEGPWSRRDPFSSLLTRPAC